MSEPVKTTLLKALKIALENILNGDGSILFKKVIHFPFIANELENVKFPIIFIFDETENKIQRNRLADCELFLHIELWEQIQIEEIRVRIDYLAAEIEKRLTGIKAYYPELSWIKQIKPRETNSVTKFYENEFSGGAVLLYNAKYLHEWGNPYNPVRS